MRNFIKTFFISVALLLAATHAEAAGSSLAAGDVAFVAFNSTAGIKTVSFVLLKDVSIGTVIDFTNSAWSSTTALATSGNKVITWTADQPYSAGKIITYNNINNTYDAGTYAQIVGTGGLGVKTSAGIDFTAFQGTTTSPAALAAFTGGQAWNSAGFPLPSGLMDGVNAWAATTYFTGGYYNCGGSSGNAVQDINADPSGALTNWTQSTSYTSTNLCTFSLTATPTASNSPTGAAPPTDTFTTASTPTAVPPTPTDTFTAAGTSTPTPTPTNMPVYALAPGDIAFTGFASNASMFSFIALKDIPSSTTIFFTNAGVTSTTGTFSAADFSSGNAQYVTFTSTTLITAGSQVVVNAASTITAGTMSATLNNGSAVVGSVAAVVSSGTIKIKFKAKGDQLFAFMGTSTTPSIIAGLNLIGFSNFQGWLASGAEGQSTSYLPGAISAAGQALYVSGTTLADWDIAGNNPTNAVFVDCVDMTAAPATLLLALNNPSNWQANDTAVYSLTGTASAICVGTATPSPTNTFTSTPVPPTSTPTNSFTAVNTPTNTFTTVNTPTNTFTSVGTPTNTSATTPTDTFTTGATPTDTFTTAATPTPTSTNTPGTALSPGDVAFVAYNSTSGIKTFSFVLLQPVVSGTVIGFTNAAWSTQTAMATSGNKVVDWIADVPYTAGKVITYSDISFTFDFGNVTQTVGTGGLGVKTTAGIDFTAFQGLTTSPQALAAFVGGEVWNSTGFPLPAGLTDGVNAWATTAYFTGGYYQCGGSSGTVVANINADPSGALSNWTQSISYTTGNLCNFAVTPSATPTNTPLPPTATSTPGSPAPTNTVGSTTPTPASTATAVGTATPSPTFTPGGGTTLAAGEADFVAFNSVTKDFSFVLLKNVSSGTVLYFTNTAWSSSTALATSGDKVVSWTATQPYTMGKIINYDQVNGFDAGSTAQPAGTGGLGINTHLLTLTMFQGTLAAPVAVTALLDGTGWNTTSSLANPSTFYPQPQGLTDGVNAWSSASYFAGGYYNCASNSGAVATVINATSSGALVNWNTSTTYNAATDLCSFSSSSSLLTGSPSSGAQVAAPKPMIGPMPQHAGMPVQLNFPKPAAGSEWWIYTMHHQLVSKMSFGPGAASWATSGIAPDVYRVKCKVTYADGSSYEGWRIIALVP